MSTDNKVIVALDHHDETELARLIQALSPKACRLKVGKTLFTRLGPDWVKSLQEKGFEIFLDMKFHDIPQQVYGACYEAAALGVWMINVHAVGGRRMLEAAKQGVLQAQKDKALKHCPKLIAVTLLTSMDAKDYAELGFKGTLKETVMRFAGLAHEAGLDGVVCSAQEAPLLKEAFGQDFLCVTPGIRLEQDDAQDQRRVMTPERAIEAGSDYLVIGRPITQAQSPLMVLNQINERVLA